ncbi:MAG: hypothetical protein RBR35_07865 [Salinivirgaceae bacterium]|nr:hypothetical protein [Salinivirgaceae bacterium]
MTRNEEHTGEGNGGADARQEVLSNSEKIALLKRMLRLRYPWPVLLLMMIAVIEPEVARRVFMKYVAEGVLPQAG